MAVDHSESLFALRHKDLEELIWDFRGHAYAILVELGFPWSTTTLIYLDLEVVRKECSVTLHHRSEVF